MRQYSAIAIFLRKSSLFNHSLDRATWLLLAPEAQSWELAWTNEGRLGLSIS